VLLYCITLYRKIHESSWSVCVLVTACIFMIYWVFSFLLIIVHGLDTILLTFIKQWHTHTCTKPTQRHRHMSRRLMSIIHGHESDTCTHLQLKYEVYFFVFLKDVCYVDVSIELPLLCSKIIYYITCFKVCIFLSTLDVVGTFNLCGYIYNYGQ